MALTKVSFSMVNGEYANVLDYGAIADYVDGAGGTDNTTAFQSAINSGKSTIYIPSGSYYISSSLSLPTNGITVIGEGRSKSILYTDQDSFVTTDTTSEVRLKSFGLWGPSYTGGSEYAINATHDIVNFLIEDVLVQRGHGFLKATGAGVDIVKLDVRDCYFYGSSSYAIYIGSGVSMNSLSFENTWFDVHGISAIRSEGSLNTGYARFDSCIFESNRGQYTLYLPNASASFSNCLWFNNGLHASGDPVVTNGVDVYLVQGNQQVTTFQNCTFSPPASDTVDWTAISIQTNQANNVSIENCYANGGSRAKYFVLTNDSYPSSLSIYNSRWVNYTSSTPIVGKAIDAVNNFSSNGQSNTYNLISSVTTTDAVATTLSGGINWGPAFKYPNAPAILMYEAKVVAGDATGAVYYSSIVREAFKVTESGGNYTFTSLGTINETPVTSGGTLAVAFTLPGNGGSSAGVALQVTGVAATTVHWTASISMTANKSL